MNTIYSIIYSDYYIINILNYLFELININNLIGIIILSGLILFSGKWGKALETTSKIVSIGTGGTIIKKNWFEGTGSGSGSDDNKDNKDDKKKKMIVIKMIKMLIKTMNLIKKIKIIIINKNYKTSWMLPFLLSNLGLEENINSNSDISYGVFLLSLIALICFINVLGLLSVHILIQKKDYETKYPKFKKIINYYKNTSLVYVIIEALLCFICLFILILFSFLRIISIS